MKAGWTVTFESALAIATPRQNRHLSTGGKATDCYLSKSGPFRKAAEMTGDPRRTAMKPPR
jgi:hypothetical protein